MAMNPGARRLQPAEYCRQALQAIEVSEERRKRRKRDTGADLSGMDIKRAILKDAIADAPSPDDFEAWLLNRVQSSRPAGPIRAMAIEILADYQNACTFQSFNEWLADGAPTPRVEDPARKRS